MIDSNVILPLPDGPQQYSELNSQIDMLDGRHIAVVAKEDSSATTTELINESTRRSFSNIFSYH